ncbi:MAG: sugar ABC transporter ATP-binding protein [Synergistaceae bacterium]|jgi:rhamnose transport system ATP-binding protein|nr:sugar ABC transporter ATP-binding protein [Synergistaceae bacterium]
MSDTSEHVENSITRPDVILELRHITKTFPGVKALDNVNFTLKRGEIHALMGENGAGKSTFIKIITGVHPADEGEMLLEGRPVRFRNPKDAQRASIAAIYQHSTSYPHLSITENIFIGHELIRAGTKTIRWRELHDRARALMLNLSCDIDPHTPVGSLTVAERQIVEIAKAISTESRIIIMDEPTASLSSRECENLYRITEKLRKDGVSIIFISHRFEDMFRLADEVTVLRDGRYVGTWDAGEISSGRLINAMVGREIDQIYPKKKNRIGEEVLRVEGYGKTGYFRGVSFTLRRGEILGFSGLVGSGRTDIMQCLFGVNAPDEGKVFLEGKEIQARHPSEALAAGIGMIPEDRHKQGLILDWEIYKNVTLGKLVKYVRGTIVRQEEERARSKSVAQRLNLKASSVYDKASSLSGGNQQKVVVCKMLDSDLKVLILDEPTKGVDVGAKSQIYEIINDLAAGGYGVIMVSSDMPELIGVCDRVIAVHEGTVTGEFTASEVTQEKLLERVMNMAGGEAV